MDAPLSRDDLFDAVLRLPEEDRISIVSQLLETLPADAPGWRDDDPNLLAELDRRSGDWDGAVTWEQLRDETRRG